MLADTAMKLSQIGSAPAARLSCYPMHHVIRVRLHHLPCCALIAGVWLIAVSASGTQFSASSVHKQPCQSWCSFCIKMNQASLPAVTNQHHPFPTLCLNSCIFHTHSIMLCSLRTTFNKHGHGNVNKSICSHLEYGCRCWNESIRVHMTGT